jgi:hypothetical protein
MLFHLQFLRAQKMTDMKEQRFCSKFCFKLRKNATENFEILEVCFGEQRNGKNTRLCVVFQFEMRYDPSGRPSTNTTEENVNKVNEIVHGNGRITTREIANML